MTSEATRMSLPRSEAGSDDEDRGRTRRAPVVKRCPFASPVRGAAAEEDDVVMEDVSAEAGKWVNAPAVPKAPTYKGCTMLERRVFMREYESYHRQCVALTTSHSRPHIMPVAACIEDRTRRQIALFELMRHVDDVSEDEWISYFSLAKYQSNEDFDPLDAALKVLKVDVKLRDATSRVGKLRVDFLKILDAHNMENAVEEEPKLMVTHLVNALAPPAFKLKNREATEEN